MVKIKYNTESDSSDASKPDKFWSKETKNLRTSDVRDALKLIEGKHIISFAGGLPDPSTFPDNEVKDIITNMSYADFSQAFQYGATPGMIDLRKELAKFVSERGINGVDESNILVSTGSQEALYMLSYLLIDRGDHVIVEAPTYVAALNAMRLRQPSLHGIKLDDDGMNLDDLENEIKSTIKKGHKIKLIYTIPCAQNPGGITMSSEKRKRLIEIANKYDIFVLEDDAYGFISFGEASPAALKSLDTQGRVIYTSTFSKILSPGLRLGWIVASKEIIAKIELMKQSVDLHTSTFSQKIALETLKRGVIQQNIPRIKMLYNQKKDVMLESLDKWFPSDCRYSRPVGGMFVFVWLNEKFDTHKLLPLALERGVAYIPGSGFYYNDKGHNTMRLNFSNPSIDEIRTGVEILGTLLKERRNGA